MGLRIERLNVPDYEAVVLAEDQSIGLLTIVAIHNTNLGPACGGLRMLPYRTREEALEDVLRLAKGMSYKSSLANIGFGGGKSVIILDPSHKTEEIFHAFGDFVHTFSGKYIAAKDMNIDSDDLRTVKKKTPHVLGIDGEKGSSGDPSPVTARGCFRALEATTQFLYGTRELSQVKVAIQGVGHVGYGLAEFISKAGGKVWVSDINAEAVKRAEKHLGAIPVEGNAIFDVDCDIFSPCARGAALNDRTIPRLRCRAIVGAANNQLATPADGFRLHEREILYAPDYAVNAGGIINIFMELDGYSETKAFAKADEIFDTLTEIYSRSRVQKTPPFVIADQLAEERIYGKAKSGKPSKS